MSRRSAAVLLVLAFAGLSALAASTKLVKSWKEPSAGVLNLKKVLVLCIGKDPFVRQTCENGFVQEMKFAQGVAANTVLTEVEVRDKEKAKPILAAQGFDGVITVRMADRKTSTVTFTGDYPHEYYDFYDYWDSVWPQVSPMTFQDSQTTVTLEINLYTLKDQKLVWSGRSDSVNPVDIPDLVDNLARAVIKDLRKKGLVK